MTLGAAWIFGPNTFFCRQQAFSMMINPPKLIGEQIGKESQEKVAKYKINMIIYIYIYIVYE